MLKVCAACIHFIQVFKIMKTVCSVGYKLEFYPWCWLLSCRCIEGYYGDPRIGVDIPCRPCPCPETAESGHSYATRCALDARTQDVVCECNVGYAGK